MKRSAAIVLFTLPLAACPLAACLTPPPLLLFSGPPGATYEDFEDARYQCAQETTVTATTVRGGRNPGFTFDTVAPICPLFNACLASKGYLENPLGEFDAALVEVIECQHDAAMP